MGMTITLNMEHPIGAHWSLSNEDLARQIEEEGMKKKLRKRR